MRWLLAIGGVAAAGGLAWWFVRRRDSSDQHASDRVNADGTTDRVYAAVPASTYRVDTVPDVYDARGRKLASSGTVVETTGDDRSIGYQGGTREDSGNIVQRYAVAQLGVVEPSDLNITIEARTVNGSRRIFLHDAIGAEREVRNGALVGGWGPKLEKIAPFVGYVTNVDTMKAAKGFQAALYQVADTKGAASAVFG